LTHLLYHSLLYPEINISLTDSVLIRLRRVYMLLLLGVLASCLTHTYLIGAAQRGISLDGVHVRFEAENNDAAFLGLETADPSYPFNIRGIVRVESQASDADLEALHAYAATTCPLTKLVREALPVKVSVEPPVSRPTR
jgi:uncharacterized OsmC-like protein